MVLSRRLRSDGDRRAEDRWNDVPFRRGTCGYGRSYDSVKRNLKDPWNHTHWWRNSRDLFDYMHLMALPAADFSKFCWNRICLILAGTVRQGDGSFLPSFCHPATDFLSGWKRADPAPRWKKPDWTAASSGADLKIDSFFELLGLRPVHRRRKPVKLFRIHVMEPGI